MSNFFVFENPEDADRYCVGQEMWSPDGGKTGVASPPRFTPQAGGETDL
jgi:rRNA maturation protein Nop10